MKRPAESVAIVFAGLCLTAAATSVWAQAHQRVTPEVDSLALTSIPARFGPWTEIRSEDGAVSPSLQDEHGRPIAIYDRIVSRTYMTPGHPPVMLMIAYKRRQYQEDRVHRPELCYYAQGFVVSRPGRQPLRLGQNGFPTASFVAEAPQRRETVLYFIRTGSAITESSLGERLTLFKAGLTNTVPDGLLVRASVVEDPATPDDAKAQIDLMNSFLSAMVSASPSNARVVLVGRSALGA